MGSIGTRSDSRAGILLQICAALAYFLSCSGTLSWKFTTSNYKFIVRLEIKYYNFCIEFDIPLALTHIKVTSLVTSSIRKNLLQGESWQDFQLWYNALTI